MVIELYSQPPRVTPLYHSSRSLFQTTNLCIFERSIACVVAYASLPVINTLNSIALQPIQYMKSHL